MSEDIANIIAEAFKGILPKNDEKLEVLTLQELAEKRKLVLAPNISKKSQHLRETFTIGHDWEIVGVERCESINDQEVFLCETGDIAPGGLGIIIPKKLSSSTILTTSSNEERLQNKIAKGKFGYLKEGDVIIAPVRVYQKKIAVVTKNATKFLFSSDFIVLRRKNGVNLLDSFALFYSLIQDENIRILESLSSPIGSITQSLLITDIQAIIKRSLSFSFFAMRIVRSLLIQTIYKRTNLCFCILQRSLTLTILKLKRGTPSV